MTNGDSKQMIVGLDIGTSKVVAVVGEIDPDGGMEVVGHWLSSFTGHEEGRRGQHRVYRQRDTTRSRGS